MLKSKEPCRWISAPPWTTMGCRETTCTVTSFARGFRESSALASLSLTLLFGELLPSYLLTPVSQFAVVQCCIFLLINVITEPLLITLIISALDPSWSQLELSLSNMAGQASHKSHICSPLTTKNLPCKLDTRSKGFHTVWITFASAKEMSQMVQVILISTWHLQQGNHTKPIDNKKTSQLAKDIYAETNNSGSSVVASVDQKFSCLALTLETCSILDTLGKPKLSQDSFQTSQRIHRTNVFDNQQWRLIPEDLNTVGALNQKDIFLLRFWFWFYFYFLLYPTLPQYLITTLS